MKEIDYFRFDRSCTIFCREKEEKVKAYLTLRAKNMQLEETGKGKTWSQLALRHGSTVLTINRSVFVGPGFAGPGRQFNKTVVGAGNFFKDAPIKDKDVRQGILDHIYGTAVILGCSADPAFSRECWMPTAHSCSINSGNPDYRCFRRRSLADPEAVAGSGARWCVIRGACKKR
jgi:hypothetical protein